MPHFHFWPLALMVFLLGPSAEKALAKSLVNRYKLVEDKLKTESLLRPPGHDFFLDVTVSVSKEALSLIEEGEAAAKSGTNETEKINNIATFLRKHNNVEQFARPALDLGIPLPQFHYLGLKFVPDIRIGGDLGLGLRLKIRELENGITSLLSLPNFDNLPQILKDYLARLNFSKDLPDAQRIDKGDDLVEKAINQGLVDRNTARSYLGRYYMPDVALPHVNLYAKSDTRVGLLVNFEKEKTWFGHFFLYQLTRTDKVLILTEQDLRFEHQIDELKKDNTQDLMGLDWKLGHNWKYVQASFSIEDIKIFTLSDHKKTGGDLYYKMTPLYRLHAHTLLKMGPFRSTPFLGVFYRQGESLTQGLYAGSIFSIKTFKDRLGLAFNTMVDAEFFTIGPRLKLWPLEIDYSLKKPFQSTTDDDMKSTILHSLNLRLSF